jgi:hypothetical protein
MRPVGEELKINLHRALVDMRKGRNGLAALAQAQMRQAGVFSGALLPSAGEAQDVLAGTAASRAHARGGRVCGLRASIEGLDRISTAEV